MAIAKELGETMGFLGKVRSGARRFARELLLHEPKKASATQAASPTTVWLILGFLQTLGGVLLLLVGGDFTLLLLGLGFLALGASDFAYRNRKSPAVLLRLTAYLLLTSAAVMSLTPFLQFF